MSSTNAPTIAELMADCTRSAVHLEMRDHYGVAAEADAFRAWLATGHLDTGPGSPDWAPWVDLVSRTVVRGVAVRRARIISEPVSDYIRYEHASTEVNVHAGEQVRVPERDLAVLVGVDGVERPRDELDGLVEQLLVAGDVGIALVPRGD